MKKETIICDLCKKEVKDNNYAEIKISEHHPVSFIYFNFQICHECANELKYNLSDGVLGEPKEPKL